MKLVDLILNFFYFWRSDYYGEPISAALAWELAKIHVKMAVEWDYEYIVKGGEE